MLAVPDTASLSPTGDGDDDDDYLTHYLTHYLPRYLTHYLPRYLTHYLTTYMRIFFFMPKAHTRLLTYQRAKRAPAVTDTAAPSQTTSERDQAVEDHAYLSERLPSLSIEKSASGA